MATGLREVPVEIILDMIMARLDLFSVEAFGRCCREYRALFRKMWDEEGHLDARVRAFALTMRRRHDEEQRMLMCDPGECVVSGRSCITSDAAMLRCHAVSDPPSDDHYFEWPPMLDDDHKVRALGMSDWQRRCLERQRRVWTARGDYLLLPLPLGVLHLVCVLIRYPSILVRLPPPHVFSVNVSVALEEEAIRRQNDEAVACGGEGGGGGAWVTLLNTSHMVCMGAMMTRDDHWNCDGDIRSNEIHSLACRIDPHGDWSDVGRYLDGEKTLCRPTVAPPTGRSRIESANGRVGTSLSREGRPSRRFARAAPDR